MTVGCAMESGVDDGGVTPPPPPPPGETNQKINLTVPGGFSVMGSTRALTQAQESKLETIHVLVFNPTTNVLVEDSQLLPSSAVTQAEGSETATLEVKLPTGSQKIMILANVGTLTAAKDATYAEVRAMCVKTIEGKMFESGGAIPMWGEVTTNVTGSSNINIRLVRSIAKIDVGVGKWDGATEQTKFWNGNDASGVKIPFVLEKIYVMRPSKGYEVIPDPTKYAGGDEDTQKPSVPAQGKFTAEESLSLFEFTGAVNNGTTSYIQREVYVPEADVHITDGGAVGDENHLNRMAVVIGGKYNGSATTTYYRVDFNGMAGLVDVLRNHHYRFDIASVTGPGLGDPGLAYESQSNDMTAIVVPWNPVDFENVLWVGDKFWGTSNDSPIDVEAYAGAVATAVFTTNVDTFTMTLGGQTLTQAGGTVQTANFNYTLSAGVTAATGGKAYTLTVTAREDNYPADTERTDTWAVDVGGVLKFSIDVVQAFSDVDPRRYPVTVSVQGSVGGHAQADRAEANAGMGVTLLASPSTGYVFDSWVFSGTALSPAPTAAELRQNRLTFTMPAGAVTATARFRRNSVTIVMDNGHPLEWAITNVADPGTFAPTDKMYDGAGNDQYSWTNATTGGTGSDGSVCPAGWRMPTREEYQELYNAAQTGNISGHNGTWYPPSPGYDNSGVAGLELVLPGGKLFFAASGNRNGASQQSTHGDYWTSTQSNSTNAYHLDFYSTSVNASFVSNKTALFSVRCVRGAEAKYMLTIHSATGGTAVGSVSEAAVGSTVRILASPSGGNVFAGWTFAGEPVTFEEGFDATMLDTNFTMPAGDVEVTPNFLPLDVTVGGIAWSNLNVDTRGNFAQSSTSYGKFYQWGRDQDWPTSGDITGWDGTNYTVASWNNGNGPCPTGWRLPTRDEYAALRMAVGGAQVGANPSNPADLYYANGGWTADYLGTGIAGTEFNPTGGEIFFPAAGYIDPDSATILRQGTSSYTWASTVHANPANNIVHLMFTMDTQIAPTSYNTSRHGFSIRCVRNILPASVFVDGVEWSGYNVGVSGKFAGASVMYDGANQYDWATAQTVCPAGWRLPSRQEYEDLINNAVSSDWVANYNGSNVNGLLVRTTAGELFFSASGGDGGVNQGASGFYWSATQLPSNPPGAYGLYFDSSYDGEADRNKTLPHSVRCVRGSERTYSVTASANVASQGSAMTNASQAVAGQTVNVQATPAPGYIFAGWNVTGTTVTVDKSINPTTFTMPAGSVDFKANFMPASVIVGDIEWAAMNVAAPNIFNTSAVAYDGANQYAWADTQTNNMQGPCPAGWKVPTSAQYASLHDSAAVGNISDYNGSFVTDYNGSGNNGLELVLPNGKLFFSASGIESGSNYLGTGGDYWTTTENSDTNAYRMYFNNTRVNTAGSNTKTFRYSIRCVRDLTQSSTGAFSITVNSVSGGSGLAAPNRADAGQTVQALASPDAGKMFTGWDVVSAPGGFTISDRLANPLIFQMPNGNVTLAPTYADVQYYDVIPGTPVNGTFTVTPKSENIPVGYRIELTVTPNSDYVFTSWTVTPTTLVINKESDTKYWFYMPQNHVNITPVFDRAKWKSTRGTMTGVAFDDVSPRNVEMGGVQSDIEIKYTATYDSADYTWGGWTVTNTTSGAAVSISSDTQNATTFVRTLVFKMPAGNVSVDTKPLTRKLHKVTRQANAGVTITPGTNAATAEGSGVNSDTSVTYRAAMDGANAAYYNWTGWAIAWTQGSPTGNASRQPTVSLPSPPDATQTEWTFQMPKGSVTVTARTTQKTLYGVTASSSPVGSSVSLSPSQTISGLSGSGYYNGQQFTATAVPTYTPSGGVVHNFAGWRVGGGVTFVSRNGYTGTFRMGTSGGTVTAVYLPSEVKVGKTTWAGTNVATSGTFASTATVYDGSNQYNWTAATAGTDNVGVCPDGWRLPTQPEYQELVDNTTDSWSGNYGYSGVAGREFTASDGSLLFFSASGSTNGAGQGLNGYYWSATQLPSDANSAYLMGANSSSVNAAHFFAKNGLHSIRCVKNVKGVTINGVVWAATNVKDGALGVGKGGEFQDVATVYDGGNQYTWQQATVVGGGVSGKPQGVCPAGWYTPSQDDYQKMYDAAVNSYGVQGGNIKGYRGTWYPASPGYQGSGVAGVEFKFGDGSSTLFFSASGNNGGSTQSTYGYYWSATQYPSNTSYASNLYFHSTYVYPGNLTNKTSRFSVRCIRPA